MYATAPASPSASSLLLMQQVVRQGRVAIFTRSALFMLADAMARPVAEAPRAALLGKHSIW